MILSVITLVLAAGQGTRMRSTLPKVLHQLGGRPLIGHVLTTAEHLKENRIVTVLSPSMPEVQSYISMHHPQVEIAHQMQALGTGHAVLSAMDILKEHADVVLVVFGDTPLLTASTLQQILDLFAQTPLSPDLVVVGFDPEQKKSYGQIYLDDDGMPVQIRETKHGAPPTPTASPLCNAGIMAFKASVISPLLRHLPQNKLSGEYYLTDLVALAHAHHHRIHLYQAQDETEFAGVNDRLDLAEMETVLQHRWRAQFCRQGVTLRDSASTFFHFDTEIAPDVIIHPHVYFGPQVRIDSDVEILPFCHLEGCHIKSKGRVGPFARLRPTTVIESQVRIGNFVEIKNTIVGSQSKINHLSYVGDASIGDQTNIGAGTITCNYDGFNKWPTTIGDHVHIGANSALVAPLTVQDHAMVGAGSTITKDVPAAALAVCRTKQVNFPEGAVRSRGRAIQKTSTSIPSEKES